MGRGSNSWAAIPSFPSNNKNIYLLPIPLIPLISEKNIYLPKNRNQKHGKGKNFYPTGGVEFEGHWKNDLRHGKGKAWGEDGGALYEGYWRDDLKDGVGSLYGQGGEILMAGSWKKGGFLRDSVDEDEDDDRATPSNSESVNGDWV